MFKSKIFRNKEMGYKFRILTIIVLFIAITIGTQVAFSEKDDRIKLETDLVSESTSKDNGHAVFEKRSDRNILKVEIVNQKLNTNFRILVEGIQVGSITTDTAGAGGIELDSRQGINIPPVKSGTKIEIIEASSVILSGIFGGNVGIAANTPSASPVTTTSVTIPLGAKDKTITEFFSPHAIQINQFDTVVWTNKDNTAHTVSGVSFDSGLISSSQTFSHKFSENGTFDYACQLHSWMTGQVIVGTGGPIIAQPPTIPSTPTSIPPSNISPQTKVSIPAGAADKNVTEFFAPKSLPVKVNDVVTWINDDSSIHTVTSGAGTKDGLFDSGLIQIGKSFSFTFTKIGTFDYFCQVHPWMTGQVVVGNDGTLQSPPISVPPSPISLPAKDPLLNNTSTSKVSIPPGAADKKVTEYFLPKTITIKNLDSIIWTNADSAAHTVTSGLADKGSDGVFDSGLVSPGKSFTFQFTKVGTVDYFCMVHPWMSGIVMVQSNGETLNNSKPVNDPNVSATGMLSDGTKISVSTSAPIAGETMEILVEFTGMVHVNEDITVTQNQDTILEEKGVHVNDGKTTYQTALLTSTDPVKIIVTFQGYGIDEPKTGPIGEEVVFSNVVPEFGTFAIMILVVSIISIITVTSKIRIIPRF